MLGFNRGLLLVGLLNNCVHVYFFYDVAYFSEIQGLLDAKIVKTVIFTATLIRGLIFGFVRSNEEIVEMISKGDSKAFDVDVLKAFIKLLPDNTEVGITLFYSTYTVCKRKT